MNETEFSQFSILNDTHHFMKIIQHYAERINGLPIFTENPPLVWITTLRIAQKLYFLARLNNLLVNNAE